MFLTKQQQFNNLKEIFEQIVGCNTWYLIILVFYDSLVKNQGCFWQFTTSVIN